nr:septal ring lytic transglycosylase RlpA family protein [Pseudomonas sp.]
MRTTRLLVPLLLALLSGCAERPSPAPAPAEPPPPVREQSFSQTGKASFYARMHHGQRTANGETHDQNALVAAHRSLPFGTRVRVTNLANGKQVVVRINDRGPFRRGRIIDVSRAAAAQLNMIDAGIVRVRIEAVP